MTETKSFDWRARARSFRYAANGVRTLLGSEHNAWIHAAATLLVIAFGLATGISRFEWCWMVVAMAGVWTAEAFNTALESLCDLASPDPHPLAQRAKDVAAGGVLISAVGAAAIGLLVLGPHLLALRG